MKLQVRKYSFKASNLNELTGENLDLALDAFFGDEKKILKTAFKSKSSEPL